ncbi:MAG: antibiotic biosynthesis monooxygenase family protein [Acidimicrobiales bacterium]
MLADTPAPPYYAVIFATTRSATDADDGYEETAARMEELARAQPGYLGIDSARSDIGITVSYWCDEAAITAWRDNFEHEEARRLGRERFYESYFLRVARVERAYSWETGESS